MKLPRRLRFLTALLMLASLAIAQVAMAAHACAMPMAVDAMVEEGHDCCEKAVPEAQPALCEAHCQQGDQSRDTPSVALPALAAPSVLAAWPAAPPATAPPPGELPSLLARAAAPPLAVRHCRFHL